MDKVHLSFAEDGWRCSRHSENGRIVAASTEAYTEKRGALENIGATQGGLFDVVEDEAPSGGTLTG